MLDRADVDTDQIIPKQFLKRIERTGFGEFLFYDWFRSGEIELEPHPILVTGRNFGSGLLARARRLGAQGLRLQGGHRAVVLGHLLFQLHQERAAAGRSSTRSTAARSPRRGEARIDLDDQTVNCADGVFQFEIDEQIKHRLLQRPRRRRDDAASAPSAIDAFEARRPRRPRPGDDVAVTSASGP